MADDIKSYCAPEDILVVSPDTPKGYPTDAINFALSRAQAVSLLLSSQFEDDGISRLTDKCICSAFGALDSELATIRTLLNYGEETENEANLA